MANREDKLKAYSIRSIIFVGNMIPGTVQYDTCRFSLGTEDANAFYLGIELQFRVLKLGAYRYIVSLTELFFKFKQ